MRRCGSGGVHLRGHPSAEEQNQFGAACDANFVFIDLFDAVTDEDISSVVINQSSKTEVDPIGWTKKQASLDGEAV